MDFESMFPASRSVEEDADKQKYAKKAEEHLARNEVDKAIACATLAVYYQLVAMDKRRL